MTDADNRNDVTAEENGSGNNETMGRGSVPTPFRLIVTMVLTALIIEIYIINIPRFASPLSSRVEAFMFAAALAAILFPIFYFILLRPLARHAAYHHKMERALRKSEERYKDIVNSMSDVFWEIGTDCAYTTISSNNEKVFGYTAEEMTGKTPFDFMPRNLADKAHIDFIDLMSRRNYIKDLEITMCRKNGNMVRLLTNALPIFKENGQIEGYRGVYRNITDRKRAEEAIKVSETKYRIIAENNYDWEFWLNPHGHFLYSSPSCERITGYEAGEFEKNQVLFQRIIHPDDQAIVSHLLEESMENQAKGFAKFRIVDKNGEEHLIESYLNPVYDNDGQFLGLRGSNRDMTDREIAEHGLKESERRFREIIENIRLAAMILDLDGQLFYCNDFFLEKTGYDAHEAMGQSFFKMFVDQDKSDEYREILLGDIDKGVVPTSSMGHVLTKGGKKVALEWNNVILRNSLGKIVGVTCIGVEITKKLAQEKVWRKSCGSKVENSLDFAAIRARKLRKLGSVG